MGVRLSRLDTSEEAPLEDVLSDLAMLVATRSADADVVFYSPLSWKTAITVEDLSGLTHETADDGSVTLELDNGQITVATLKLLQHALTMSGTKKISELRALLEANPNPLGNVFGPGYEQGKRLTSMHAALDAASQTKHQELLHAIDGYDVDGDDGNDADDEDQGNSDPTEDSHEAALTAAMHKAEAEVAKLRNVAGVDDDDLLDELDWETSITFANGLRLPAWRTGDGDMGVIIAKPRDGDRIFVMANVDGFWQIKGADAGGNIDYDRIGKQYGTLVELLRAKSPLFDEGVDSASFDSKMPFLDDDDDGDERRHSTRPHVSINEATPRKSFRVSRIWLTDEDEQSVFDKATDALQKAVVAPCERGASFGLAVDQPTSPSTGTKQSTLRMMRSGLLNSRRMSAASSSWLPMQTLQV